MFTVRSVDIGDFVETREGVSGILTCVRQGYSDPVAFIATSDGRTYYCPVFHLLDCEYVGKIDKPIPAGANR